MENSKNAINIFYSYSRKDIFYRENLVKKLQHYEFNNTIIQKYDEKIPPGSNWNDEIAKFIKEADIFIALISSNYLESKECMSELLSASERKGDTPLTMVPVIISDSMWDSCGHIKKLQKIPRFKDNLASYEDQNMAFVAAAREIIAIIDTIKNTPSIKNKPSENTAHNDYQEAFSILNDIKKRPKKQAGKKIKIPINIKDTKTIPFSSNLSYIFELPIGDTVKIYYDIIGKENDDSEKYPLIAEGEVANSLESIKIGLYEAEVLILFGYYFEAVTKANFPTLPEVRLKTALKLISIKELPPASPKKDTAAESTAPSKT